MKKLLITICVLALTSCTHLDQKVNLDITTTNNHQSHTGNGLGLSIEVYDDRAESKIIGIKKFCDDKVIKITSDQNLAKLLQQEIREGLFKKGYKKGTDKLIEISIQKFRYRAQCGVMVGKSRADISVTVSVTDSKNGTNIAKNFKLSANNSHFLAPLEKTDSKIINNIVSEVVEDILNNDILLRL